MTISKRIEGVILDWDGVCNFYRPFRFSLPHYNRAAVRAFNTVAAAKGLSCNVDFNHAVNLANQSFFDHGLSTKYFTDAYGLDPLQMHLEFHHEIPREKVVVPVPGFKEAISELNQNYKLIILSQGSRYWIENDMAAYGIQNICDVVAFEDNALEKKSTSERPLLSAIERMGLCPTRIAMAEDMKKNLRIPSRFGLQTAFIEKSGLEKRWIDRPNPEDTFINQSFPTVIPFIEQLLR